MPKISVDFKRDENNNFIIERLSFKSKCLTKDTICKDCCFFSGKMYHGFNEFFGTCLIYKFVADYSFVSDDIVYGDTKCKVFNYLKSLDIED